MHPELRPMVTKLVINGDGIDALYSMEIKVGSEEKQVLRW